MRGARSPRRDPTATWTVVVALLLGSLALASTPAVAQDDDPAPPDTTQVTEVTDVTDVTEVTVNEFIPEDANLSDCLGALERPGCGSSERGGWAQTALFLAILAALGVIAWRVVVASKRARASAAGTATDDVPSGP